MSRVSSRVSRQDGFESDPPEPKTVGIRTYRQIAQILVAREGASITPARVAQICRRAERKVARALLLDPDVRAHMRLSDSTLQS